MTFSAPPVLPCTDTLKLYTWSTAQSQTKVEFQCGVPVRLFGSKSEAAYSSKIAAKFDFSRTS